MSCHLSVVRVRYRISFSVDSSSRGYFNSFTPYHALLVGQNFRTVAIDKGSVSERNVMAKGNSGTRVSPARKHVHSARQRRGSRTRKDTELSLHGRNRIKTKEGEADGGVGMCWSVYTRGCVIPRLRKKDGIYFTFLSSTKRPSGLYCKMKGITQWVS